MFGSYISFVHPLGLGARRACTTQPKTYRHCDRSAHLALAVANDGAANPRTRILDLLDQASLGDGSVAERSETRGYLDEVISQLEKSSPCAEPVSDELLNGAWKVRYSGSVAPGVLTSPTRELELALYNGGSSLGGLLNTFAAGIWGQLLGFKVLSLKVQIKGNRDVEAFAEVDVFGQEQVVSYSAEILPVSSTRLIEEVSSLRLPAPLRDQHFPLGIKRQILVTYLDEDLMVVRDESGIPDVLLRDVDDWNLAAQATVQHATQGQQTFTSPGSSLPSSLLKEGRPDFSGSWKVVDYEGNVNKWMEDIGIGWPKRSAARAISFGKGRATWNIRQQGNRSIETRATGIGPSESFDFVIGGPRQKVETLSGVEVWDPTWKGNILEVEARSKDGKVTSLMRRYFVDERTLIMESTSAKTNVRVSWKYRRQ